MRARARHRPAARVRKAPVLSSSGLLSYSDAQLRAILGTAVDGIITIDEQGVIRLFNPAAERIFGYRAREVLGRPVSILMVDPYCNEHRGYIERYLQSNRPRIIGIGFSSSIRTPKRRTPKRSTRATCSRSPRPSWPRCSSSGSA